METATNNNSTTGNTTDVTTPATGNTAKKGTSGTNGKKGATGKTAKTPATGGTSGTVNATPQPVNFPDIKLGAIIQFKSDLKSGGNNYYACHTLENELPTVSSTGQQFTVKKDQTVMHLATCKIAANGDLISPAPKFNKVVENANLDKKLNMATGKNQKSDTIISDKLAQLAKLTTPAKKGNK